jgi:predicted glycoside hydrolase/deacetylase ChbG (UPF0249 family)
MVLSPRWPQDVALLKDLPQAIDVGLHLDWTSEFALAHGHGLTLGAAMLKATLGGFGRGAAAAQTRAVIERQLDAFEAQWKAPPDYVDGHQHVQQFAGIREALVQALVRRYGAGHQSIVTASEAWQSMHGSPQAFGLRDDETDDHHGRLPYLRISRAPLGHADLKSRIIAAMGASALEKLAAKAGLPAAPALLGVYDFAGDQNRYGALMEGWLQAAPERCIIMCHPAQDVPAQDAIGAARLREFAYFSSTQFPAALEHASARIVRGMSFDR